MKIPVNIKNESDGEVFVVGVWGPKTIDKILKMLNTDIANVNRALRNLA